MATAGGSKRSGLKQRARGGGQRLRLPPALALRLYAHCMGCGDDPDAVAADAVTFFLDDCEDAAAAEMLDALLVPAAAGARS